MAHNGQYSMILASISFSTPSWLINYYHFIGIISLIISSFGVYLILFKSVKLGMFRYFLLWFQMSCVLTDISTTVLLQPVTLLPLWALYAVGYAWKCFRMSFRETTLFFMLSIGQLFAALVCCFVVKHQTICQLNHKYLIPRYIFNCCLVAAQFVIITFIIFFYVAQNDQETALRIVQERFPSLIRQFETLPTFQVFAENMAFPVFLALCALTGSLVILVIGCSTLHMIHILNSNRRKISGANFLRQQQAVKSLAAQFVTSGLAFFPPVVCFIILLLEPVHSQEISFLMFAVFSTHSTVNCLVMIITSPEYRKVIVKRKKSSNIMPIVFQRVNST